jgi:hypothetical protein
MGKRSSFERIGNDYYRTFDPKAVNKLAPHLQPGTRFIEPCAGDGVLADQLIKAGHKCLQSYDIDPQRADVEKRDALTYEPDHAGFVWITNPPWSREILHPLIRHLSDQSATWLLFDADWAFTDQAKPFKRRLRRIVVVGRLRWIPDTKMTGKDNCAWYLFDKPDPFAPTLFY